MLKYLLLLGIVFNVLFPAYSASYLQGYPKQFLYSESQTTTTSAGTLTLTKDSFENQFFSGSSTHSAKLPDATTLNIHRKFLFSNKSTGAVTVKYNDSSSALVIASGDSASFYLKDKSTGNGIWEIVSGVAGANTSLSNLVGVLVNSTGFEFSNASFIASVSGATTAQMSYRTGASTAGASGQANFRSGDSAGGASGVTSYRSGNVTSGNFSSGSSTLTTGTVVGTLASGAVAITTGNPGATATGGSGQTGIQTGSVAGGAAGNSGIIFINTGTVSGASNNTGNVSSRSGNNTGTGNSGTNSLGTGSTTNGFSGSNTIFTGAAIGGVSGDLSLGTGSSTTTAGSVFAGPGPAPTAGNFRASGGDSTSGTGGQGILTSGAGPSNQNSGQTNINTANATGSGNSGPISISTGTVSGGTRGIVSISGLNLDLNNIQIKNVSNPTSAQDAATKNYVDTNALTNPLTTTGDIIYASGAVPTRLAIGASGQVLTVSGGLPSWISSSGASSSYTSGTVVTFDSSGTWTAPTSISSAIIEGAGGGMSGQCFTNTDIANCLATPDTIDNCDAHGGWSSLKGTQLVTVVPGTVYTITIGSGGSQGQSNSGTNTTMTGSGFTTVTFYAASAKNGSRYNGTYTINSNGQYLTGSDDGDALGSAPGPYGNGVNGLSFSNNGFGTAASANSGAGGGSGRATSGCFGGGAGGSGKLKIRF